MAENGLNLRGGGEGEIGGSVRNFGGNLGLCLISRQNGFLGQKVGRLVKESRVRPSSRWIDGGVNIDEMVTSGLAVIHPELGNLRTFPSLLLGALVEYSLKTFG